jgi:hypothetical protein
MDHKRKPEGTMENIDFKDMSTKDLKDAMRRLGIDDSSKPKFKSKTFEGFKYFAKSVTGVAKEVAPIADTLGGALFTAGGAAVRVYTEPALEKAGEMATGAADRLQTMAVKRELEKELKRREAIELLEAATRNR